jgi:hypothetical protein
MAPNDGIITVYIITTVETDKSCCDICIYEAKSTLYSEIEEARQKWQKEWVNCTKAAITKPYFRHIQDRLKLKININPLFAAMVTGYGKTMAYLH